MREYAGLFQALRAETTGSKRPRPLVVAICKQSWEFSLRIPCYAYGEIELTFALFLELQHRRAGGDFDLAVDDGALGYGDGASTDLAADHRGVADFQFVPDVETSRDLAGDDGLLRLDESVPGSRRGQIEAALQLTVAMHLAGHHEMPGAADVADEHRLGADESGGAPTAFQKSSFRFAHGRSLSYSGRTVM